MLLKQDTLEIGKFGSVPVWITAFILLVAALQWAIPYPLDDDTAYHFAVARLIREHGILQSFPWTRFSWQFDHYADKEFLFHLLFVPFTGLGYETASRVVGTIGGAAVISSLFLVLRAERVRLAGLWALLPLGTTIFLYRFSQVRPHLFSIALAITLLWAYCRKRHALLFAIALLYPLCYVAFWQLPLLLVLAAEWGGRLSGERWCWKTQIVLFAGIVSGIILHPNTWNLLQINWIHMADILFRNAWGKHPEFNLGEEFEPFSATDWVQYMAVPTLAMVWSVRPVWRTRQEGLFLPVAGLATLIFLLLTLRTNRFLEYSVPFSFLTLALAARQTGSRWLLPAFVVLSVVWTLLTGATLVKYIASSESRIWQMDKGVAKTIASQIPAGSQVFTCGWEYTGTLMAELPDRNYLVALDPTLLYKRDPALYDLWYRTLKGAPRDSAEIVRRSFVSRYIVCLDHPSLHPFFDAIAHDKNAKAFLNDGKWVAFDLGR
ncbi:MAG TPA: hypothetical protein VFF53_13290 [Geobacteraceae bacterium]|nr:hypothetical protein [Geobacteraceae bacterium]